MKKNNIYIDLANLVFESKKFNIEIDFLRFYFWLKNKYKPDNIFIFTGYLKRLDSLYKENQKIGYKYIFKDAVYNQDENKIKANCDVDISIKVVLDTLENDLGSCILISSDGDFASLLDFLISRYIQVRLISPAIAGKCSYLLKRKNIPIVFLAQVLKHFSNKKPSTKTKLRRGLFLGYLKIISKSY